MVSSDTVPFLLSHIMPVFTMQVEKWSINLRDSDGENYLEQLLAEVESVK